MNRATLRLVLLISCCHALVHVYEHSLASVEQLIAADSDFGVPVAEQKELSGELGNCLRLPFGLFGLLAGWLADRYGAKRLLVIYLLGCAAASVMAWFAPGLAMLYLSMFTLGLFASIYHPAGVALIAHETTPENRPMALGYHGIFGSAGIAAGPFLAGLVLNTGADWRQYFLLLAIPGVLLAILLIARLPRDRHIKTNDDKSGATDEDETVCWHSYVVLMMFTSLAGFVYAAILTFLPRYLDGAGFQIENIPRESLRNYLTGAVMLLGVIGQYAAGRIARPTTLEPLMAVAMFAAAPFVFWMGFAQGPSRLWAAALFTPLFFMHQPLFNSMVAKYVPRRRRSLCYGLSFTLGFGVGSFGPNFAGHMTSDLLNFSVLGIILCLAACLSLLLWHWNRPERELPLGPDATEDALV